ncbi:hypothetical protein PPYR_06155 [Photinus pyralis]|uniref:Acyltransferase n=1 Tax=Photinus pyralis TaxID=7054 RepID=A0A1Y1NGN8_PHOPY|nr:2-acylglycerol O-acyltransferase 2-like [Photinus pyralis]KAB0800415.1 hypothetical protein PPYR_06155 [Photinus pyralis]
MSVGTFIKRKLEFLAVACLALTLAFGPLVGFFVAGYLLVYSSYRYYVILYIAWIYLYDLNTCERGGRRLRWVRSLPWWTYARRYFPVSFEKDDNVELDPTRNYMMCSFPHGVYPLSAFLAFACESDGFKNHFPNFTPFGITLKINFLCPFYREFMLAMGMCSSSAESIRWMLNKKEGGNVVIISVGGASEAMHSKPGQYTLVLKNRKGFVKLALETGSPLVPVLSFGEPDLLDQLPNPIGSKMRAFQEWAKKRMGYAPIIPKGRGIFQNSFGILPKQKPVTTVVGPPLDVQKIDNPSPEEISIVHQKFVDHLVEFFEQHKHKYVDDADNVKLVIL